MKSSLADAEIEEEIKAAKKEYQAIVNAARVTGSELPPGMSRHDLTTWKEQQALAARMRLAELEDRLQRLQMLRTKLARMKANADDTLLAPCGGSWTLPGQVQPQKTQQPGTTAKLGTMNASGEEGTTQYFDEDDPDSPARNAEPYQPPFTPGMSGLRTIVRDQVALGMRKIVRYKSNKVSQVVTQNSNTPEAEAGVSKVVNLFTLCPCPAEQRRLPAACAASPASPGRGIRMGRLSSEDPLNLCACGRHQGPISGCE